MSKTILLPEIETLGEGFVSIVLAWTSSKEPTKFLLHFLGEGSKFEDEIP